MQTLTSDWLKRSLTRPIWALTGLVVVALGLLGVLVFLQIFPPRSPSDTPPVSKAVVVPSDSNFVHLWTPPADWRLDRLPSEQRALTRYGRELITHTADYLGPNGSVRRMANGLNCQNCHLKAGTQPWGNNLAAVAATYPRFRERSGLFETKVKRVNDCFQRSLNGKPLDSTSREMRAILAYIDWLGVDVPRKTMPRGAGIYKLKELRRAADPIRGLTIYTRKCQSCHQRDGAGTLAPGRRSYTYPPLWGPHSYNQGAGMFRLSNLAGYVRYNMPLGTTYERPQLTNEEAWDVAAYINAQPRPAMDLSHDWPNLATKPIDHPFGPYADPFSEQQHKFGSFQAIKKWKDSHSVMAQSAKKLVIHL